MKGIIQIGIWSMVMLFSLQAEAQTSVFNWDVDNPHYIQPLDFGPFNINYFDEDGLTPDASTGFPVSSFVATDMLSVGNDVLMAVSFFNPTGQADNWVVFGPISHPIGVTSIFSWEHWILVNSIRDGYEVLVTNIGPNPIDFSGATIIKSYTDNDPLTNGHDTLTTQSAVIPAPFMGGPVYIAIHHNANNQWGIAFDKFDVTQTIASTASSFSVTECDSYTVPSGDETHTTSGTYMDTVPNSVGADSVMTITVNINYSNTGTDTQAACNTYTWIDGNTYSSSNSTASHVLTNAIGCDSTVTLNLTIDTVNTDLGINVISGPPLLQQLYALQTGAAYLWLNCPSMSPITGETNQSYTIPANGDYAVIISNGSCIDTSECASITGVGIIENNFGNKLLVYPNPTDGNFSIDLGETFDAVTITITDLSGKLIKSKTYNESQLLNLKLEEPAGVYFLMIESGDKKTVIRLVKE